MAVRPLGSGYDPNSGWSPDDSTGVSWDSDVDLSGYGNFGRGGFAGNPKLTGPATGPPPGVSLSGPGGVGGNPTPNINANLSARPAPVGGPQLTPNAAAPGMWDRIKGILPGILAGAGPAAVPALAVGGAGAGLWAEPRTPRVDPRISAAGTGGFDVEQPLGASASAPIDPYGLTRTRTPDAPIDPYGPTRANAPIDPYGPTRTPIGSPAPAVPPIRPRAAGPAAARQQPNLGAYGGTIFRPNMDVVQGGRNNPGQQTQMGVMDWSRLFQRPQQ